MGFIPNGVTTEGVNEALNRMFIGQAQTQWWIGIIDQSGFSGVSVTDTHVSHPGWVEFTGYSGNRSLWMPIAASSGIMSTTVGSTFNVTAGGNLRGTFLASRATTGTGAGAVIYCTAITLAADVVPVSASDVLTITYVTRIAGI